VPVRQPTAVELDVETKPLCRVGHLHRARDPGVLIHPGANEISSTVHNEIDVLLKPEDMLRLQQRRLEQ
tara:strand:+ start:1712 stop:1918 length:207 start_codon:yes stop_codon:yes gene_type:complete